MAMREDVTTVIKTILSWRERNGLPISEAPWAGANAVLQGQRPFGDRGTPEAKAWRDALAEFAEQAEEDEEDGIAVTAERAALAGHAREILSR